MPGGGRGSWRLLAVGLLVLAAGCNGATGPSATETPTVTPAPVPAQDRGFSPGVTAGGMNTSAVLAAHERQLRNRSYTLRTALTVQNRSTGATVWREVTVARVGADSTPVIHTTNLSEPRAFDGLVSAQLYYDGTTTTRRSVYANGSVGFDRFDRQTSVNIRNVGLLRRTIFQLENVRVRRGTGDHTVVSGTLPFPRVLPRPPNVRATGAATLSLTITSDGLIDRIVYGYDAGSRDGPARVRFSTRITDLGSTTVERPEWLDETTTEGR